MQNEETVHLFRFPNDSKERETWIKCLPNANFKYTHSKRLCEKHWPVGYTTKIINRNGVLGPALPLGGDTSIMCANSDQPKNAYQHHHVDAEEVILHNPLTQISI